MNKATKILATIGPESQDINIIENLVLSGVNLFRLNFSHGDYEYHEQSVKNIRNVMDKLKANVGILQDISGPKVRVGEVDGEFHLIPKDELIFVKEVVKGYCKEKGKYVVSTNYPNLLDKVKVGEYIYLCDGLIRTKIVKIGKEVVARVENSGLLTSKKGINFPNTPLNVDVLTTKDRLDVAWGIKNKMDFMAISFVQTKQDITNVRELLGGYEVKLIAKIEKFDAVENIDSIIEVSDGIMVARGDLGIELPYDKVPKIQKDIIKKSNKAAKPVIIATQMLLSMTTSERATRAEVSDVANAVLDGADCVMLSEESAIGVDPVNVVKTMSNIISSIEEIYDHEKTKKLSYLDERDPIQATVANLADSIGAKGIIVLSGSGFSFTKVSRYRPKTPIYAFSNNKEALQTASIDWGVCSVGIIDGTSGEDIINASIKMLDKNNILDKSGPYVITLGTTLWEQGSTNTIKILNQEDIANSLKS
jgi:pyruvate kinase